MGADTPDFSGWATKANLRCSDGRTITRDAFKDQDRMRVPLVWQHGHNEPSNILGHAMLSNKEEGVWCDAYFNTSEMGQTAKIAVQHGDITSLSIYANKLVEKSKSVMHGIIREVSLVIAGANPGAVIDPLTIRHADDSYEEVQDAAIIYTGETLMHGASNTEEPVEETTPDEVEKEEEVQHADDNSDGGETIQDVFDTLTDKQKRVVYYLVGQSDKGSDVAKHGDVDPDEDAPSADEIDEVYHSLNDKQETVLHYLLGTILEHADNGETGETGEDSDEAPASVETTNASDDSAAHSDSEEGTTMSNVFENNAGVQTGRASSGTTLSHAQQAEIFALARRHGGATSLKEIVEDYAKDTLQHGIEEIETLFPDAKNVTTTPEWLTRRTEWVAKVISGTRHVPFARISSSTADLTLDEARAKGYVKGNFKKEQFFKIAKRKTGPTTIYKKQKLDRDDVVDITDFDVVVWIKGEMRLMLEEEIARAVLLGDGRAADDDDKVDEESIRPIATDAELFVTRVYVDDTADDYDVKNTIKLLIKNRRHYRGTGSPTFFTSETFLSDALLIEDGVQRRIYNSVSDVATALRVSEIVTVELLDQPVTDVVGVMVNLNDYTIGADKGGAVALFDDFDIDFNQLKWLIETRMSGALVKAKSAIVVLRSTPDATLVDPVAPAYNKTTNVLTVATTTGVTYRNKATNAVLTNGSPVTLAEGESIVVVAEPTSGHYLESSANDEFSYAYGRGRIAGSIY